MRNLSEDTKSSNNKRFIDVLLLSMLAHAVLFSAILLLAAFLPMPKISVPAPTPTTTLTLMQAPPAPPKPKQIFIPTPSQANVQPKIQQVVSANDTNMASKSTVARKPDSIMPDLTGKTHAPDMNSTPNVQAPPKQEVSSTPPTPKLDKPEKPTPPQLNPSQGTQPSQQPTTKPAPPTPPKPKPQPQQVDENGFPILPALNVATMAPPNSAAPTPTPAPSDPQQMANAPGGIGQHGDNSPAAMKTALGAYKQKVYRAVGSHWYPKIDKSLQVLGVGVVHIQFTIHSDGTVDTKVLDDANGALQLLSSISLNSIREAAPFDQFPPEMVKELISQGGDGTSYTDDFSFSIYGSGN